VYDTYENTLYLPPPENTHTHTHTHTRARARARKHIQTIPFQKGFGQFLIKTAF